MGDTLNPTYFVSTISENTEAQVRKYIETLLTVPRRRPPAGLLAK